VYEVGDRLGYVHVGENHRGYLGSGHLDFGGFFHALADIHYAGPITFESLVLCSRHGGALERPGDLAQRMVGRHGPGPARACVPDHVPRRGSPAHDAWSLTLVRVREDLLARARTLAEGPARALLGVTGTPGAGKTTLAELLVAALRADPPAGCGTESVAYLPMDGFHLADVELDRLGRRSRKGAPDTFDAAGYAATLRRLRDNVDEVVYAPAFERTLEQPIAGAIPLPSGARLVVTEGNYLLLDDGPWAPVRGLLDEVWYVEADEAERLRRLVARHVQFGKAADAAADWVEQVDQRNAAAIVATRDRADLVVSL
jgi:pantothenate kinase